MGLLDRAGPPHRRRLHRPDAFPESLGDAREALRAGRRADPERERHGLDAGAGAPDGKGARGLFGDNDRLSRARHEQGEGGRPRDPLRRGRPLHGQPGARPHGHAHPAREGDHGRDRAVRRRRKRARPRRHGLEAGRRPRSRPARAASPSSRTAGRPESSTGSSRARASGPSSRPRPGAERSMTEDEDFLEGNMGPVEIAKRARLAARRLASLSSEDERSSSFERSPTGSTRRETPSSKRTGRTCSPPAPPSKKSLSPRSLLDRLVLDDDEAALRWPPAFGPSPRCPDPSGRVLSRTLLDDGLVLEKVTCPLGVLLVIFESRPDAVRADRVAGAQVGQRGDPQGRARVRPLHGGAPRRLRKSSCVLSRDPRRRALLRGGPGRGGRAPRARRAHRPRHPAGRVRPRQARPGARRGSPSSATRRASATSTWIARRTRRWRRRSSSTASSSTRPRATPPRRFSSTATPRRGSSSRCSSGSRRGGRGDPRLRKDASARAVTRSRARRGGGLADGIRRADPRPSSSWSRSTRPWST